MSMNTGVSGLQAANESLSVISNNIANANTTGYKSMEAQFADVYSSTSASGGVYVSDIETSYAQGTLVYTSSATDMAIDGNGFFVMEDANGQQYYTRAGNFSTDKDDNLVNDQGQALMGYGVDENGNLIDGQLQPLTVNTADLPAQSTSDAEIVANMDAREEALDPAAFDPSKPDTYHSTTSTVIYDSQGNEQRLSSYYIKTGENTWEVMYEVDGNPVQFDDGSGTMVDYSVSLEFDEYGKIKTSSDSQSGAHATAGEFSIPLDFNNGALNMDLTGMSQYGNDFSVSSNSQNGYPAGQFYGVSVTKEGAVVATYSNGESQVQGYVALATFPNEGGLDSSGNTSWSSTPESGEALIGLPGTGSKGSVSGNSLENSNVDMSAELVDMIVAQSAYQANTKTISTFDENTQYLLNTF